MLMDGMRLSDALREIECDPARSFAVSSLVGFLQKRLGIEFMVRTSSVPNASIRHAARIARILKDSGIVEATWRRPSLSDEPAFHIWVTRYAAGGGLTAGGSSIRSEGEAFISALAEALERYIWMSTDDYFSSPFKATAEEAARGRHIIEPSRFVGFSEAQRTSNPDLAISSSDTFSWIGARSLTSGKKVFIPAQVVSALHGRIRETGEKKIRLPITTGLATGPTAEFARLNGVLEVLERDAYMVWWLNQLTLPRVDLRDLSKRREDLQTLLERCHRYNLEVYAVRLLTDAPTHVLAAIVCDPAQKPPITIGLKAHRDPSIAFEGALLEALRGRLSVRLNNESEAYAHLEARQVRLKHRLGYWSNPERALQLTFMYAGKIVPLAREAWESDTDAQHLDRILSWARRSGHEVAEVDMGISEKNPLPWSVRMITMPEMQPLHLDERYQYLGGSRLRDIPRMFGYTPRNKPFSAEPHPLA